MSFLNCELTFNSQFLFISWRDEEQLWHVPNSRYTAKSVLPCGSFVFLAPKTFSHPLLLTDDFKFIQAQDRYRPPCSEYINEFHSVLLVISDYSKCLKVNLRLPIFLRSSLHVDGSITSASTSNWIYMYMIRLHQWKSWAQEHSYMCD